MKTTIWISAGLLGLALLVTPATADQVILDDLIVDGSACIGFDCVNGESFGFDTIRIKENNLRIKAQDTSSSASFPSNDWQITFNETTNGGANKFSIDDIDGGRTPFTIEAGAPNHSLYVDDGGRIGLGTSTPVVEVHVKDGDTPTVRLEQDGTSGFTPQTWDMAGNETNYFIRDATNGSTLPFRIRPGAPTSALDIAVDGDICIGCSTVAAGAQMHIENTGGDDVDDIVFHEDGRIGVGTAAPDATVRIHMFDPGAVNTGFRFENSAGTWDTRVDTVGRFLVSNVGGAGASLRIDDANGEVTVLNDFTVNGTKNFAVPDPTGADQMIYFSALEGPEAGTYYRGTAATVDGEAVIELPDYFSKMTEAAGLTVQLTPLGGWHQLYVASKSPSELVIRDAGEGDGVEFDYIVQGVRLGYSDFQVERPMPEAD